MTTEEIKAQLWARVYADCLNRKVIWFEAKEEADRAVVWFDRRDGKNTGSDSGTQGEGVEA